MTFNESQLNILKQYDYHFNNAVNREFLRSLTRIEFEKIKNVYTEATGAKVTTNSNCGICKLKFIKQVGILYFKDIEESKKIQEEKNGEEILFKPKQTRNKTKNATSPKAGKKRMVKQKDI